MMDFRQGQRAPGLAPRTRARGDSISSHVIPAEAQRRAGISSTAPFPVMVGLDPTISLPLEQGPRVKPEDDGITGRPQA